MYIMKLKKITLNMYAERIFRCLFSSKVSSTLFLSFLMLLSGKLAFLSQGWHPF